MDPTISFILQALMGVLMLFFGIILNGLRNDMKTDRELTVASLKEVREDLKQLNDAVLGKYALREDVERWREVHLKEETDRWTKHYEEHAQTMRDQRKLDHDVRDYIQVINVTLAKMQGKQYGEK